MQKDRIKRNKIKVKMLPKNNFGLNFFIRPPLTGGFFCERFLFAISKKQAKVILATPNCLKYVGGVIVLNDFSFSLLARDVIFVGSKSKFLERILPVFKDKF